MNQIATLFTIALIGSALADAPIRFQESPSSGPYPAAAPYPASAPYPVRVVPHSEYGPPEVKVVSAPVIMTEYTYEIPEQPKPSFPYPPAVSTGPYPVRVVVPHQDYGLPETKVVVPVQTGPYPAPAPYPVRVVAPHSEYGVPEVKLVPAPVIKTEYIYEIPEQPKPSLPYPAPYPSRVVVPHQDYGLPETKVVVPHTEYGTPEVKLVPAPVIKTEYAYEIPQTPAPAAYPARVPHQEYGLPPLKSGPYPARVVVPHKEYGL